MELTNKEEIEDVIHLGNHTKFIQTNSTLAISIPLVQELGFLGDTEQYDQILKGTYTSSPLLD